MNIIASMKFGRISYQWMRGSGITPKDNGMIAQRAWQYVRNLKMEPADAWMISLLNWMDELPPVAQVPMARGLQRFLDQYEGRVALSGSVLESIRGVATGILADGLEDSGPALKPFSDLSQGARFDVDPFPIPARSAPPPLPIPPQVQPARPGSSGLMDANVNLAGRIAGALDYVIQTRGPAALARGCVRISEQGAISFWPQKSSPGGACLAVANLADYPEAKLLDTLGTEDSDFTRMAIDGLAIAIVRAFAKAGVR
jgi:hypothetical protein